MKNILLEFMKVIQHYEKKIQEIDEKRHTDKDLIFEKKRQEALGEKLKEKRKIKRNTWYLQNKKSYKTTS